MRILQVENPYLALGLVVEYLRDKPEIAKLPFGEWTSVLVGQLVRKQYFFIIENELIVGFIGWALTNKEKADQWLLGKELKSKDCLDGECLLINIWAANTDKVNTKIFNLLKYMFRNKSYIYSKRHKNGIIKPIRFKVQHGK